MSGVGKWVPDQFKVVLLRGEWVGASSYWCRQAFPYVFVCPCLLLHVDHPRVGYFNLCYQTVMNRSLHCLFSSQFTAIFCRIMVMELKKYKQSRVLAHWVSEVWRRILFFFLFFFPFFIYLCIYIFYFDFGEFLPSFDGIWGNLLLDVPGLSKKKAI